MSNHETDPRIAAPLTITDATLSIMYSDFHLHPDSLLTATSPESYRAFRDVVRGHLARIAAPPPPPALDGLDARVARLEHDLRQLDDATNAIVTNHRKALDAHATALKALQGAAENVATIIGSHDAALAEVRQEVNGLRGWQRRYKEHTHLVFDGRTTQPGVSRDSAPPDPGPEVTSNSANSHSLRANTRTPPDPAPEGGGIWASFLGEPVPDPAPEDITEEEDDANIAFLADLDARRARGDERLVIAEAEAEGEGPLVTLFERTVESMVRVAKQEDWGELRAWDEVVEETAEFAVTHARALGLTPAPALVVDSALIRRLRIACEMHGHPVPSTGMAADILESTLTAAGQGETNDR